MARVTLLILMLWLPMTGGAAEDEVELAWSELEPVVVGKKVVMVLPDGVRIKGPVTEVGLDGLVMDVKNSSDQKLQPKGKRTLPRASVTTVEIQERGRKWQILGAAIGAGIAAVPAYFCGEYCYNEAGSRACALPPIAVGAGLGYLAGRSSDKRITRITVKNSAEVTSRVEVRSEEVSRSRRLTSGVNGRASYPPICFTNTR